MDLLRRLFNDGINAFKGQVDGSSTKFYFWERYFCGAAYRLREISNICCVASGVLGKVDI